MATEAFVTKFPKCDFCSNEAHYDGKTKLGPWGYMCDSHFINVGTGLGTGRGQKLVIERLEEDGNDKMAAAKAAIAAGDWDAFEEAVGDEDPTMYL